MLGMPGCPLLVHMLVIDHDHHVLSAKQGVFQRFQQKKTPAGAGHVYRFSVYRAHGVVGAPGAGLLPILCICCAHICDRWLTTDAVVDPYKAPRVQSLLVAMPERNCL